MQKYKREMDAIDRAITLFNSYLIAQFHIPLFNIASGVMLSSIVKVVHQDWNAFPFPNNGTRGVYFVLGYEKTRTEQNGLYIGKASFGSTTSNRLYAHLNPSRNNEHFTMNGYRGEVYIVDYIASIDLDKLNIFFMSSALEEHLISTLIKESINLINGTGNLKSQTNHRS